MASPFDSIKVSAPGLGADTQPEPSNLMPIAPEQPTVLPSGLRTLPSARPQTQSQQPAVGSTGLMARVEPDEFVKVVTAAGTGVVLYTPQISPTPQRVAIDRYVASISGVIFVTLATKALRFPAGIQVVSASAVLCDNRPLSSQDTM